MICILYIHIMFYVYYSMITINVNELNSPIKRKNIILFLLTGSYETGMLVPSLQMKELRLSVGKKLIQGLSTPEY